MNRLSPSGHVVGPGPGNGRPVTGTDLASRLRDAVAAGAVRVWHQPLVDLASGATGAAVGHRVHKRYLHADGSSVPVEVHAASVRTAEGEPYCIVAHVLPASARGDA